MKVPSRIAGSSLQHFDFEVSSKNTDPKEETSSWLVDSLQKPQQEDDFLFLNFHLWTHILRSEIDQLTYSQMAKICCFLEKTLRMMKQSNSSL